MSSYDLRFIDPASGEVVQTEEIPAESDVIAIAIGELRAGWPPMELWKEDRRVYRWILP